MIMVRNSGCEVIANSFLLNIAKHETFSANKYENADYGWHFHIYKQFPCSAELSMIFFLQQQGLVSEYLE